MGLIISKIMNGNDNSKENFTKTGENKNTTFGDKETRKILQTPRLRIKSDIKAKEQQLKPLKSLKLDPRSPTIGIYRTPIIVEEANNVAKYKNFDSPVSIYSTNITNSTIQDIMTPLEPPANVSGFEKNSYNEESFLSFDNSTPVKESEKKVSLRVKYKPTTVEAKKLLEEINLDSKNCVKKNFTPTKKNCKIISKDNSEKILNDLKINLVKTRTPLSNITSAGNSPSQITTLQGKLFSRSKAISEFGAENSSSPLGQNLARWDTNNTIII